MEEGMMGRFSLFCEQVYFLVASQVRGMAGLLAGGIVLGIFPALYATFAVMETRLRHPETETNAGNVFWSVYKTSFLKCQLYGYVWLALGLFLYYDIRLLFSYSNVLAFAGACLLVSLLFIYLLSSLLILPIAVRYRLTVLNSVRLSGTIAILIPFVSLALTILTIGCGLVLVYVPLLFLFCGVSFLAAASTKIASYAFRRMEQSGYLRLGDAGSQ
ncbi:YesL family protein [Sediminibacillus halophilus]|uniref:Uncharacterized membrane protein YesL n=1 Tax=Sediminibacillus halophilus TaxID=482461 RepID=A0A1G9RTQ7_9BACI|nr:DUF624 domain-containing protein [Sediminibacillus halophilus]SDM26563.1 Uncharacterized membrane protein YesL [Sediminibacillus halophilus]